MKKILYIIFAGVWLSSCSLDIDPKNAITFERFFRTEADLFSVVAEMHGETRETFAKITYHDHMGARIDRVSNNASVYERLRNLDANTISLPTSQQQWKRYYNVLTLGDLFMDNYHKAKNVPAERLDFCLGQVQFLRALNYFWLARIWGDAVITKGSSFAGKYAKSSTREVLDTAIYYAKQAYRLLPQYADMKGSGGRTLTSKQYGCKGSTAALLAHIYAWRGSRLNDTESLERSEEWADKILEPEFQAEVGKYSLAANPEEVCTNTLRRGGAESIFELEISYIDSNYAQFIVGISLISYPIKRNSLPQDALNTSYGIYTSSVNAMYAEQDLRRSAYFYTPKSESEINSAGLAYLNKWRYPRYGTSFTGEAVFQNLDCNKVIFRVADIQLLRAECRLKLGDQSGAINDLNAIRTRAGAALFPDSEENETTGNLQRIIFREREKELLYEGHRYYDVVRNGNQFVRTELSEGFRVLTDDEIRNGALHLPVPKAAFENNDLMIQNTYWLSKMK